MRCEALSSDAAMGRICAGDTPDDLIKRPCAALPRKQPLCSKRSAPTTGNATWCFRPAFASAGQQASRTGSRSRRCVTVHAANPPSFEDAAMLS